MVHEFEVRGNIVAKTLEEAQGLWASDLLGVNWDTRGFGQDESEVEDQETAGQRTRFYFRTVFIRNS